MPGLYVRRGRVKEPSRFLPFFPIFPDFFPLFPILANFSLSGVALCPLAPPHPPRGYTTASVHTQIWLIFALGKGEGLYFIPTPEKPIYFIPTPEKYFIPTPEKPIYFIPTPEKPIYFIPTPEKPIYFIPTPEKPRKGMVIEAGNVLQRNVHQHMIWIPFPKMREHLNGIKEAPNGLFLKPPYNYKVFYSRPKT